MTTLQSVTFRADAGRLLGTGHVMRCLTLADALAAAGVQCRFVTRAHDGHLADVIRQRGHDVALLPRPARPAPPGDLAHSAWLGVDQQTDAAETAAALAGEPPEWIVVDHYALDHRWESTLRSRCRRIMAIDDLADRRHDCDLLLDQNVVAGAEHRYDGLVPASCGLMIGPRFALLQPAYADLHARMTPRTGPVRRILMCFGGGDVAGSTEKALTGLIPLLDGSFQIDLVINGSLPQAPAIRARVAGLPDVVLHESLPSLAQLIASADLAIGGAGATALERCCLGVPSIVVTLAANQRPGAAELHRLGAVEWLGDEADVDSSRIGAAVAAMMNGDISTEMSRRCLTLLDGRGTATVAGFLLLGPSTPLHARPTTAVDEALLLNWANDTGEREDMRKAKDIAATIQRPLKARRATEQDAQLLWEWANDPDVRASAFNTASISWERHLDWFYRRLPDPNCLISIIFDGSNRPVGQVRFDGDGKEAVVGIIVAPALRGHGYATSVLRLGLGLLFENPAWQTVHAWIKKGNTPSQRTFANAGFHCVGETEMHGVKVVGYRLSRHEFF